MIKYLPLLILLFSCKGNDTQLQAEIQDLKNQIETNQKELAALKQDETGFVHSVYFWLKEDATQEQKDDFVKNGMHILKDCKDLAAIYFGPPANTPREIVDNSYDYAWLCHFKNKEAHDAYQVDSLHKVFVEKYGPLFKEVKIYDNLVIN